MALVFSGFIPRIVLGMLSISVPLIIALYLAITQYMAVFEEDEFVTEVRSKARLVAELLAHQEGVDNVKRALDDLLLSGEIIYASAPGSSAFLSSTIPSNFFVLKLSISK